MPGLAHVLWFDDRGEMAMPEAMRVVASFIADAAARVRIDRRAGLEPFLAPAMARRHAELFAACVEP
jgi:hypothetical protein